MPYCLWRQVSVMLSWPVSFGFAGKVFLQEQLGRAGFELVFFLPGLPKPLPLHLVLGSNP